MIKLYNSLGKKLEEFKPITAGKVGIYSCGPTVYFNVHIGNLRTYLFADILKRVMKYNGLQVKHVVNITDVGHLTSDADSGDDKLEKGAAREGKTVWDVAKFYTDAFLNDIKRLNIISPEVLPKATDHIPEQIAIIQELEKKGFIYDTPEAVYFDVSKFPEYGKLSGQKLEDKLTAAREGVVEDKSKKHPADFALWFKRVGKYENHIMHWASPWGDGFPGWHIECSAMSTKYLGQPFDIHTGGVDLLPVHHTNEIAQSEAANGKALANVWMHGEHLLINEGRMAKSEGNFLTLDNVIEKGFTPLAYRYLILTAHYRSKMNFSWESIEGAQNTLNNLYQIVATFEEGGKIIPEYETGFKDAINNDLDMPKAVAVMWDMLKSENISAGKLATVLAFDQVLGLQIADSRIAANDIPTHVKKLVELRELARKNKDYPKSDELRLEIEKAGFIVEDNPKGVVIQKKFR